MKYHLLHGDCLTELGGIADASVDSIVTDPPYGLSNTKPAQVAETITRWASGERDYLPGGRGFMGKEWDGFVPPPAVWDECMRVLKPGGHMLVFAGTRTQDLMGLSIRLAGFDIRDGIGWIYGSGFPKSMDVSKAIDKAGPATPEARQWEGWGTALKPAIEPVIVARKPFKGTVAANVLAHGTGGINVDGCRVPTDDFLGRASGGWQPDGYVGGTSQKYDNAANVSTEGRFPPNVLLDPEAAAAMDEQSGILAVAGNKPDSLRTGTKDGPTKPRDSQVPTYTGGPTVAYKDRGGASRFFPVFKYQAKAPTKERPRYTDEDGRVIQHATVKPLELMRWLVRLVTPPGGVVLDPFAGSGATVEAALLEGMSPIGIEREADYIPLIEARIERSTKETS